MRTLGLFSIVLGLTIAACGPTGVNTTPAIQVAEYGVKVQQAVRAGQESVIALNKQDPNFMTDATTRKVLDGVDKVTAASQKLHDALLTYDKATSLDFKKLKAEEVNQLADEVAKLAGAAFNVGNTGPLGARLAQLASSIISAVEAVKLQLARVK